MGTGGLNHQTYAWQLEYRQNLLPWLAASEGWVNEGHVPGHHRDGSATQLWLKLPFSWDELDFSVGGGAYSYFDTQGTGDASRDVHGMGTILSAAVTGDLDERAFWRVMYQRITPRADFQTNTATVGFGVWLGQGTRHQPVPDSNPVTEQEFTVYGGQTVVNTLASEKGVAYAAEFRTGVLPHVDWTLSYINEGDPRVIRRNGLATQIWPVNAFFDRRLAVGIGVGLYGYLDRKHPSETTVLGLRHPPALAGLVTPTISYRLSDHWLVRLNWNRVVSNYDRDADLFMLGLGCRFGRHFDLSAL